MNTVDSQSKQGFLLVAGARSLSLVLVGLGLYIVEPLLFPTPLPAEPESAIAATVEDARVAVARRRLCAGRSAVARDHPGESGRCRCVSDCRGGRLEVGRCGQAALAYYRATPKTAKEQYAKSRWAIGNVVLLQGSCVRPNNCIVRRSSSTPPTSWPTSGWLSFSALKGGAGNRFPTLLRAHPPGPDLHGAVAVVGHGRQPQRGKRSDHRGIEKGQSQRLDPADWASPHLDVRRQV